jgi:hypothetical protein
VKYDTEIGVVLTTMAAIPSILEDQSTTHILRQLTLSVADTASQIRMCVMLLISEISLGDRTGRYLLRSDILLEILK